MAQDELTHGVIEALHAAPDGWRTVLRDVAAARPDLPAREMEAALFAAAREIDASVRRAGNPTDEARIARRLALLLSMDIDRHADGSDVTMGALRDWWATQDDFFLRL